MPTITFDVGVANLTVPCTRAGNAPMRRIGAVSDSASGVGRNGVRRELMEIPLAFVQVDDVTAAQIEALFALGAFVPCAGDVLNNGGATVTFWGDYTDDLLEAAPMRVPGLTLHEVNAAASVSTMTSQFLLTSVESPDSGGDPTILVGYPDSFSYPGDAASGYRALASATPSVGGGATTVGGTPERSWLSLPLNAGIASGTPYIVVERAMDPGPNTGSTVWAQMDTFATLKQLRPDGMGGWTTIAGPITSSTLGEALGDGAGTMYFPSPIIWAIAQGDQLLIEFYSTIALQPLGSDNGQRQLIAYGMVPGPRPAPRLVIGGTLTSAP